MKKVIRIMLAFSILMLPSCDFLRKVASRPTSDEIALKEELINIRSRELRDSIVADKIAQQERWNRMADSTYAMDRLKSLSIRMSKVLGNGEPIEMLFCRYYIVTGTYRTQSTFLSEMDKLVQHGFMPISFSYENGLRTICLGGADSLNEIADLMERGFEAGVCPKDAWIFENVQIQ